MQFTFLWGTLHGSICSLHSVNNGDTVVRLPWWTLRQRPRLVTANTIREGKNRGPQPPTSRGMVNRDFEEGDNNEA
jgi:spore germination protein KA